MSSINGFEDDHSKLNGVTKTTTSLKEETQTPIADGETPIRVEADQELSSKGQDDRVQEKLSQNLEATKDGNRGPNGEKGAEQRAKPHVNEEDESNLPSMKDTDDVKRAVSQTSTESRSDRLIEEFKDEALKQKIKMISDFLENSLSDVNGTNSNKERRILKSLDVTEKDEKKTGIRHRKIVPDGDAKVILRSGDPLISTTESPEWWLTTIKTENVSEHNSWEIKVADKEVIACIQETIHDYLVHTGGSFNWTKDQISLKSGFVEIIVNWSSLKKISKKGSTEDVAGSARIEGGAVERSSAERYSRRTYERIDLVLKYVQEFRPRPIEILEKTPVEIEFDYLWTLFRPGKLVVTTWSQDSVEYPQVFKVSQFGMKEKGTRSAFLRIEAWMFDWNGTDIDRTLFYLTVPSFEINSGAAVKPVRSLEVYPVEYYTNDAGQTGIAAIYAHEVYQNRRKSIIEYAVNGEGKRSQSRLHYAGDVLHTESTGPRSTLAYRKTDSAFEEVLTLDEKLDTVRRVKIEENIVLDAENYIRKGPGRRLLGKMIPINKAPCNCTLCLDFDTQAWLTKIRRGELTEDRNNNDLLLPPRLFGYALARKDWFQFAIDKIRPDDKHSEDLNSVIFPRSIGQDAQRNMVQMVKNYSKFMAHPNQRIGDFIGGKGTSLIFLFHGPSGTGKTFCAEALASDSGKSLFKVGISDIGLNAAQAEKKLRDIFELAEAWNVILLIDEADVLLDARGKDENEGALTKNALVSVLLRELEYFKGILVMTTNRLIVLDPAVISRIHYSIYFETLSPEQENSLWERWAERLEKRGLLAKPYWNAKGWLQETTSQSGGGIMPLNGREIRNTWINAQLLSFGEGGKVNVGKDELQSCFNARQRFQRESQTLKLKAENYARTQ